METVTKSLKFALEHDGQGGLTRGQFAGKGDRACYVELPDEFNRNSSYVLDMVKQKLRTSGMDLLEKEDFYFYAVIYQGDEVVEKESVESIKQAEEFFEAKY
jgi:hypothetical protein